MKRHDVNYDQDQLFSDALSVHKCSVVQLNHYHKVFLALSSSSLERNELLPFEENCAIDTA